MCSNHRQAFQQQHYSSVLSLINRGEHYIALNSLSDEDGDEIPAESVNYLQRGTQNEIDENNGDDGDKIAKNASTKAEEIRKMENDNGDHDMSADSAASQAAKGSVKQGEGESDNYDDDEAPKRLPNELLDIPSDFQMNCWIK